MYRFQHYVPVCTRYRPVHTGMYQKPWFRTTGHDSRCTDSCSPLRRHSISLSSRIILLCPRAAKTAEWQLGKALEAFNLQQDATGLDKFDHVSWESEKNSSCAKHVNGRGTCKEKGAVVLALAINFSRNDRNVGGRLGHQHGFGRLAASGQAGDSDMVGGGPPSPARAPVSGIHTYPISLPIRILHTYPNYPTYVSQLSYISCHLSHLSATCLCSG